MKIDLKVDLAARNDELRRFIESRAAFALGFYADWIEAVTIKVGTVFAPADGKDKGCRVQVDLIGMPSVVTENLESNFFVAIHRAIDRAGWEVAHSATQPVLPTARAANSGTGSGAMPALDRAA